MSLKTRIVALVLALLLLSLWGFATRVTVVLKDDIEKLISGQLSAQVTYIANELDEELRFRIESLKEIAARIVVDRRASPARVQRLLDERNPFVTMFRLGLVIVNRDGVIVAARAPGHDYAERLQLATRRMVSVLEQERQRLARELHDRVSSNLAAIRLDLEIMDKQLADKDFGGLSDRVSDCLALTEDAAITSREISSDLHPAVLDYMGIVPALKDLGDKFGKRANIAVVVAGAEPGIKLPAEKEIALYRIAQEALMNCSKHARAAHVAIYLDRNSERVQLSIADDGIGFSTQKPGQDGHAPGLGLLAMQKRAEAIGAKCRIESIPGKGTRVIVDVPT